MVFPHFPVTLLDRPASNPPSAVFALEVAFFNLCGAGSFGPRKLSNVTAGLLARKRKGTHYVTLFITCGFVACAKKLSFVREPHCFTSAPSPDGVTRS